MRSVAIGLAACLFASLGGLTPAAAAFPPPAFPPPGATTCSGCHAVPGHATADMSIYGQDADKLAARMEAFRSGAASSTVMGRLMKGFSPSDIQAIAAWVAEQH